jgi:hypothetical protein
VNSSLDFALGLAPRAADIALLRSATRLTLVVRPSKAPITKHLDPDSSYRNRFIGQLSLSYKKDSPQPIPRFHLSGADLSPSAPRQAPGTDP